MKRCEEYRSKGCGVSASASAYMCMCVILTSAKYHAMCGPYNVVVVVVVKVIVDSEWYLGGSI